MSWPALFLIFQKEKKMGELRRVKRRRKFKPYKPRNFIYSGDSLYTVPCPNKIIKWMRQNLRRAARRFQIVFPLQRIAARNIMDEYNISVRRK